MIHPIYRDQRHKAHYGGIFLHHMSDNYVDLSDLYVDLSDLNIDLSDLNVDLSLIHLLENKSLNCVIVQLMPYR